MLAKRVKLKRNQSAHLNGALPSPTSEWPKITKSSLLSSKKNKMMDMKLMLWSIMQPSS